ncbi:hypothetical protein DJ568_07510 [Mucilaginibacter hurinus]|uniref:Uncharacterized protein n=1 Tax=Mucilaginibacter hurinus TaxID=2201324 RepID=A0A367GSQ8_9SPHI|nr:hypothetical protein DJ568_07510 [Mucilaginibacter hurinus]
MKMILKYLSLLLTSGLIIPFYYYYTPCKYVAAYKQGSKTIYKHTKQQYKNNLIILDDMVIILFPALKKMK